MKLRRSEHDRVELNLIPLIDVVFMLLIFFMVTTTFNQYSGISIELPVANSEPAKTNQEALEVAIDADGAFYVNQQEVLNPEIEALKRALSQAAEGLEGPSLIINADANTPHQAVVTAMNAAQQLGLVHMTFTTRTTEPAP